MHGSTTDSLTAAYQGFAGELQRYAAARVRDREAAEDIVQEAFLRLAIEQRAGRYPENVRAWLYRVASNEIVSRARRAATATRHLAAEPGRSVDDESPEQRYLSVEAALRLGTALRQVSPRGQRGLVLAAEGYSGREIAQRLGSTEVAMRAVMCRARKAVRRELHDDAVEQAWARWSPAWAGR